MADEWERIFEGKFDELRHNYAMDSWKMTLERVTKNHPLRREKKWEWFLGEQCYVTFRCTKCDHFWESARGWISFWIWRENPANGRRQGRVAVHILGQKCMRCNAKNKNLGYITGEVHGDEIEAVLSYLFMEIDYQFYKNESYTDIDERAIEKKRKDALKERISEENGDNGNEVKKPIRRPGSHIRHGCQACQQKVCTKKVSKPYAGVPEVNTN